MPYMVNKDSKPAGPNKPTQRASGEPRQLTMPLLIGAAVVVVLFMVFMYHSYVNPVVKPATIVTKVPPLPGYPDLYPYNTKEWQEQAKKGRAPRLSGVPPHMPGMPQQPSGSSTQ
ncbi:MAG TPA: hypothetical protein VFB38_19040 [Chthonomonadaceae bacterium]|nr:hypothetical protein [Chthonomonadaceae bacterium]